jgi:hypothetical protein
VHSLAEEHGGNHEFAMRAIGSEPFRPDGADANKKNTGEKPDIDFSELNHEPGMWETGSRRPST